MWTIIVITIMYVVLVMLLMAKSLLFAQQPSWNNNYFHNSLYDFIEKQRDSKIIIHVHQKDLEGIWNGGSAEFALLSQCCVFFESQKYVCIAPVFLSCVRIRDY